MISKICLLAITLSILPSCSRSEADAKNMSNSNKPDSIELNNSALNDQSIYCRLYMDAKPNAKLSILVKKVDVASNKNTKRTWIIKKDKTDDLGPPFNIKMTAQSDPLDLPYIWLVENDEGFFGKIVWAQFFNKEGMEMTFVSNKFSEPLLGHCGRLSTAADKKIEQK